VRALARRSTFETDLTPTDDPATHGPQIKRAPAPAWVWIAAGVVVAAAAGGAYYGITENSRPVTGTVTASW
jgi:hypothetical protein